MKKIIAIFLTVLSFSTFLLSSASAITFRSGENISISKSILDDVYILAGNATIDDDVWGDLYVLGGIVTINENIHEDLVVIGGRVTVHGDVFGDLRVLGGQISVYGNVGDDLVTTGGQVDIGKSSVIGGSLVTATGIVTLDGKVMEDLRGAVGMLFINGVVGQDVIVTVQDTINISESASIYGDLKYSALIEASIPANVVEGEISFNKFQEGSLENLTYMYLLRKLLSYISALVLAFMLVLLCPKTLAKSAKLTKDNVLKAFGFGILAVIIAFIGSILLMVTIIGIQLGVIIFSLFLIVLFVAKIFASVWLAGYVINFKRKISRKKLFGGIAIALLIYYLLAMVPYVGWLINLVLFLIGVGSLLLIKIEHYRFLKSKNWV